MSEKKLNIVCAGTGYFSQFHYEAWKRLADEVVLGGVYNRTISSAERFAKQYDIPHATDDLEALLVSLSPDILDVITPPATHLHMVTLAAKHKVDVICQKPFGQTLEDAEKMVAIAEDAGIKLIVHENFRFMPWYRHIKHLLDSDYCGHVLNAQFLLRPGDGQGPDAYLARQPYFQKMEKFLVHETAIHLVDTFRYLFGDVSSVYADLRRCNPVISGEDSGIIVFTFPSNMRALFDGNRLLDHASTNTRRTMGEFSIAGTRGNIRLDGEANIWLRKFGEQEEALSQYTWRDQNFGGDCVFELIKHCVSHYQNGSRLENTGRDYLANIRIENAIYQSADAHQRIQTK